MYGEASLQTGRASTRAQLGGGARRARTRSPCGSCTRPVLTSPRRSAGCASRRTSADRCVGVIAWMHTFSPAKMWIAGPQRAAEAAAASAHAVQPRSAVGRDRHGLHEPAPVGARRSRVRAPRDPHGAAAQDGRRPRQRPGGAASGSGSGRAPPAGWHEAHQLRVARFGDNMREVAVTEGDKVEAQIRLGVSVNGYGIGELAAAVRGARRRRGRRARRRVRRDATRSRPSSAPAASAASRFATRRGSRRACATFLDRPAASRRSPTRSRICTG